MGDHRAPQSITCFKIIKGAEEVAQWQSFFSAEMRIPRTHTETGTAMDTCNPIVLQQADTVVNMCVQSQCPTANWHSSEHV